jgi:hypothetical protein
MKPSTKPSTKPSRNSIERINLTRSAPARKGSVYEYIKSVKNILLQIIHDAKRPDVVESGTYDLLVLMAIEIANTLPTLKQDLGLEANDEEGLRESMKEIALDSENNGEYNGENNAEDIFEKVNEVYTILIEQLRSYSSTLRSGNMNRIESNEMLLMNIAVTLDGAIQEAKNQLVSAKPEESEESEEYEEYDESEGSELDGLLTMMNALKPFSA